MNDVQDENSRHLQSREADGTPEVPESPFQDIPIDSLHRCQHCERVRVSASEEAKANYFRTRRSWKYQLPHTMDDVSNAASDGCPFFGWVLGQVTRANTPREQLRSLQIQLDLETRRTGSYLFAENTDAVAVLVSTMDYSWPVSRFDVVSHFGTY